MTCRMCQQIPAEIGRKERALAKPKKSRGKAKPRPSPKGDIAPSLTPGGIEHHVVSEAIIAAQQAKN